MANFHLTLCFNGETTETQLDKLQQEAGKLQIHEFDVTLDEFGFFQKPAGSGQREKTG